MNSFGQGYAYHSVLYTKGNARYVRYERKQKQNAEPPRWETGGGIEERA